MADLVVNWCWENPWYTVAAVCLLCNILLLLDVGQDVPILFPLRWLCSGPHRPTKEYARLKSKYMIRR